MKSKGDAYVAFRSDRMRLDALKSRNFWGFMAVAATAYCAGDLPNIEQILGLALYIASALTWAHR